MFRFLFCRHIEEFHKFFGAILFIQIFESVVGLSVTLSLLLFNDFLSDVINFVLKVVCTSGQIFEIAIFCYLGNEIYTSVS